MKYKRISDINWKILVVSVLLVNFVLRLVIYYNTELFSFSDYSTYLSAVDKISIDGKIPLLIGNFLYAISYIGYFAKHIMGNLDFFFIFNCIAGTATSLILFILVLKITGNRMAGLLTMILHTIYVEFMVFSSVFYTPVLVIFLLALFLLFIFEYYSVDGIGKRILYLGILSVIFTLSFFFKPVLKYLPWFLMIYSIFWIRRDRAFVKASLIFSLCLLSAGFLLKLSGAITHPERNVIANDFVFFGHTDYGGDGGEGSFIYPENRLRYEQALAEYKTRNNIVETDMKQLNQFHKQEIIKFVTGHPVQWIKLQFTKLFRTFGIVPEGTSFKVLYTGLLKGKLWLTAIIVVLPVAIILLLFILFFNLSSTKKLLSRYFTRPLSSSSGSSGHRYFLYVYLLLFIYYIIATTFFGHYQERYRIPIIVLFIIPVLSYFMVSYNRKEFLTKRSLLSRIFIVVMVLTIWGFQAAKAIGNRDRLEKAIELVR